MVQKGARTCLRRGIALDPHTERFVKTLSALGHETSVLELPVRTATAQDAAVAVGAELRQIAKSLLFRAGDQPILAIIAGHNRVDTNKLAGLVGTKIRFADASFAVSATGYPVGGVPPFGHPRPLPTFIDEELLTCNIIYAGAGSPNSLFTVRPQQLLALTGGQAADIKR